MDDSSFPHYLNFPFQSIFNCPYQKEIPTLLYLDIQPSCRIYMYKLGLVLELKYYWKIQWHESDVTDSIYTFLSIRIPYWYKMYTMVFHCSVLSASSDWELMKRINDKILGVKGLMQILNSNTQKVLNLLFI